MYSFESRIRYSEVDKDGILTIESLIDYFQDCSTFQTEDGPASMEYLRKKNIAWVLNTWQIEIFRYPKLCEYVTIGTIPYELKGFFGHRNFFMDTKDGERLAVANSVWTLYDFSKGIPSRVTPEIIEAYPVESRLDMNYGERKIKLPTDAKVYEAEEIVVRKNHLDTNNHVNNGQYIRMAIEALPNKDVTVHSLRAEYRKQALLGDVIYPEVMETIDNTDDKYTVNLKAGDKESFCIVELNERRDK